jgi:hypothetical protein
VEETLVPTKLDNRMRRHPTAAWHSLALAALVLANATAVAACTPWWSNRR